MKLRAVQILIGQNLRMNFSFPEKEKYNDNNNNSNSYKKKAAKQTKQTISRCLRQI